MRFAIQSSYTFIHTKIIQYHIILWKLSFYIYFLVLLTTQKCEFVWSYDPQLELKSHSSPKARHATRARHDDFIKRRRFTIELFFCLLSQIVRLGGSILMIVLFLKTGRYFPCSPILIRSSLDNANHEKRSTWMRDNFTNN